VNFYKRYMGDFARDTAHLTMLQRGAYNDLLDYYYSTGKALPADKPSLYRIAKAMSAAEKKAVDQVADQFFPVNGDGTRHNKRADEEIAKHERQAEINRTLGKKGGRPRKTEPITESDSESETESVLKPEPNREPNRNPNHSHSQKPEESKAKEATASLSEPAVPDCPQREMIALYAKHLPILTQPRVWEGNRAAEMRARWRQCAKPTEAWPGYRTKEEGLAFWEQFFAGVAQSRKLTNGIPRHDGSVWRPDLEWLMKASNFAKVIEGKYHS